MRGACTRGRARNSAVAVTHQNQLTYDIVQKVGLACGHACANPLDMGNLRDRQAINLSVTGCLLDRWQGATCVATMKALLPLVSLFQDNLF